MPNWQSWEHVVTCKLTGRPIATKLDGGSCACSPDHHECVFRNLPEEQVYFNGETLELRDNQPPMALSHGEHVVRRIYRDNELVFSAEDHGFTTDPIRLRISPWLVLIGVVLVVILIHALQHAR